VETMKPLSTLRFGHGLVVLNNSLYGARCFVRQKSVLEDAFEDALFFDALRWLEAHHACALIVSTSLTFVTVHSVATVQVCSGGVRG
jgi:hypothetical protein